ncbi:23S rRNA (guanosine(2251)-2'-O)-methyltransferase RlmB [Pseudobdellovibrio exovorus]|uniref:RNA methyltransferase n=1 Tax=Pseudobdellovibrio exovorus JSS TaxID=1184267 RepID=M4VA99_9BACT|nr:23S rRNA (guanosine(2251)-2'-O)-methyltransferase RlmB [Pseudobdellovibrio exovorus]AGH96143.1 RNA methyltransferase [Pseudobdellovibrio exovorus JSS]
MRRNNNTRSQGKPSSGRSHNSGGRAGTPDRKPEKLAYPKSWRQVAGTHAIMELLSVRPKTIQTVLLQNNWHSSSELRDLAEKLEAKKIKIEMKSEQQLQDICRSHQGAVAFSDEYLDFDYENSAWENNGLILALDGVEDTQNLGAILRTSWLMGVNGVIIPEDRAVGLTATVHKVACGGVEHVPVHRTNQFAAPFETLKQSGFWVFGLSHKAKKTIYDLQIPEKVIWVLGAEDKGMRAPTEKACDELVSIPQMSPHASYNVSVSAALALAETKRQWSAKR